MFSPKKMSELQPMVYDVVGTRSDEERKTDRGIRVSENQALFVPNINNLFDYNESKVETRLDK